MSTHLRELQKWFAAMITQPLQPNHLLKDSDASEYIIPTLHLTPHKRIEIYHEQYWLRLIKVMQENFPGLKCFFDCKEFNHKIAIPYLHTYPSTSFSLNFLGDKLLSWLDAHYQENDKNLVLNIATIDWVMVLSFFAAVKKIPNEIEETTKLNMQPHVHLFALDADYFTFREELLKYSFKNKPILHKETCYIILYRNLENDVAWKKISYPAFLFLTYIKAGNSLSTACQKLEELDSKIAEEEMPLWIYEWFTKGLLIHY